MRDNQLLEEGQKALREEISKSGKRGKWLGLSASLLLSGILYHKEFLQANSLEDLSVNLLPVTGVALAISLLVYVIHVPKNSVDIQKEYGLQGLRTLGWWLGFVTQLFLFLACGFGGFHLLSLMVVYKALFFLIIFSLFSFAAYKYYMAAEHGK